MKILQDMKSEISIPLSTLIKLSGIFPGSLKFACVMPIFKKGDQHDCKGPSTIKFCPN